MKALDYYNQLEKESKYYEKRLKECKDNNAGACYYLGYFSCGSDKYRIKLKEKYLKKLKKRCESNIYEACRYTSEMLGDMKKKDLSLKYMNKAIEIAKGYCEQDSKEACFNVAYYYLLKPGSNINERLKYYKKSCDLKYPWACRNLMMIYEDEDEKVLDSDKAKYYKNKACEYGAKSYCD